MKITKKWLKEKDACEDGYDWFCKQNETDSIKLIKKLMEENLFRYANWLIVNLMEYKQYVAYEVFAAELALPIYEAQHPDNSVLREAIEAARKCIDDPRDENKKKAYTAVSTAFSTTIAEHAFYVAPAAYCAAFSAAADVADYTFYVVSAVTAANCAFMGMNTQKEIQQKIIEYGIKLLEEKQ